MNNYMKSLLKLVDVSLCEKYATKDNQSDTEYSFRILRIWASLKTRLIKEKTDRCGSCKKSFRRRAFALQGRLTKQMSCIAVFSQKGFLEMPLILIPDVYNRNMLAKRITERYLKNKIMGENYILIEEIKKFLMYQSKVYYYIMVTYALLTIDYLLRTEKSDISNDKNIAEEYIRRIIFKGINNSFTNYHKLPKNQFEKISFVIDDVSRYFRKPKHDFYTKENFKAYFSTDIFKLDNDDNMYLEFYFQLLSEDISKTSFV